MLRSCLRDYAGAYILVKGTITTTVAGDNAYARWADERNKGVIFKNCTPFTKCRSRIHNKDIDTTQNIAIVIPMYKLIEYGDNYSKASGSLWQYYKDEPNDNLENSEPFKSKVKITVNTPDGGNTKDVEIIVPSKNLSNFWRTLEMPLISCDVNLILDWFEDFVITNSAGVGKFAITATKLYIPVVTLSTQDDAKLLQQLKSGFRGTINWNKYQSCIKTSAQNRYLNDLVDAIFQVSNTLFVLPSKNENDRIEHHIQLIFFQK